MDLVDVCLRLRTAAWALREASNAAIAHHAEAQTEATRVRSAAIGNVMALVDGLYEGCKETMNAEGWKP